MDLEKYRINDIAEEGLFSDDKSIKITFRDQGILRLYQYKNIIVRSYNMALLDNMNSRWDGCAAGLKDDGYNLLSTMYNELSNFYDYFSKAADELQSRFEMKDRAVDNELGEKYDATLRTTIRNVQAFTRGVELISGAIIDVEPRVKAKILKLVEDFIVLDQRIAKGLIEYRVKMYDSKSFMSKTFNGRQLSENASLFGIYQALNQMTGYCISIVMKACPPK